MMKYYIDNFRGLQNQIINLKKVNFLVGENSTGKSSIIKAISLMSDIRFWMNGELAMDDFELGTFEDMLSAEHTRDFFSLGVIFDSSKSLNIMCFSNDNGLPKLQQQILFVNRILFVVSKDLLTSKVSYKILRNVNLTYTEVSEILNIVESKQFKKEKENYLPNEFPTNMPLNYCLQFLLSQNNEIKNIFKKQNSESILMNIKDYMYVAPIRAKPQNIYIGTKVSYNAEGSQTPYIIRDAIKAKSKAMDALRTFGVESGMFDDVITSVFGDKEIAPFELKVRKGKNEFRIASVGYGVSQILPIIVDILFSTTQIMLIQQPEVHLHPKAQAAFGQFLYKMSKIKKNTIYIIETHSDYIIDRFRYCEKDDEEKVPAQVYFSQNDSHHNLLQIIPIKDDGKYDENDISDYRSFFMDEAIKLMEI